MYNNQYVHFKMLCTKVNKNIALKRRKSFGFKGY